MATASYPLYKETEHFYWFISSVPKGNIYKGLFLAPADIPAVTHSYNEQVLPMVGELKNVRLATEPR